MANQLLKKIVLTGPESSGKTTLARELAQRFDTQMVPEFARDFLEDLDRSYVESDLLQIAQGQIDLEEKISYNAHQYLFCDTNLIVIKVWSEYRFGRCHPQIIEWIEQRPYDLYVLCTPDIPWEPDPLRENPSDRMKLFHLYRKELDFFGKKYIEVTGSHEDRMRQVLKEVDSNF